MDAVLLGFGVVFLAELGDKSQLLVLSFATRRGTAPVLLGLVLASATLMAVSVAVGGAVARVVPGRLMDIAAGAAFLGFAVWTLLERGGGEDDEGGVPVASGSSARTVLAVAAAIAVAELGDKTMLATFTLAATHGVVATWAGATAGMVAADGVAVLVGRQLRSSLSARTVRLVAVLLFAGFGAVLVVKGVTA